MAFHAYFFLKINFITAGLDVTVYTKTHIYEKFGHVFYNITEVKVDFQMSGLTLRLNNIFPGAKVLGELNAMFLH